MKQTNNKEIVIVSKPLGPPWNDSGKNLVRDIIAHIPEERFRAFVPRGVRLGFPHVTEEELYGSSGSYAPALSQNLRLFLRLLKPDRRAGIYHFFFAPNPRSSQAARILIRVKRKPCVQNISSKPGSFDNVEDLIFGDRVIVHSNFTRREIEARGVRNVTRIYPGIVPPPSPDSERQRRAEALVGGRDGSLILYPGDYRFSGAIPALTAAIPAVRARHPRSRFILACRIKTPEDRQYEKNMVEKLEADGTRDAVVIINDVPDFIALISLCDLIIFPATSLYAKMDIPLALIECLAMGKPLIITDSPPLKEILKRPAGILIPPDSPDDLSRAILELLSDEERRQTMGEEGRQTVSEHFDIRKLALQYAEIYKELRDETNF